MKKMKLAAIFAGLVSVFTFSSCLNDGDSGPNYDLYEIVTVEDGSIFGGPVLKGDACNGEVLYGIYEETCILLPQ